MGNLAAIACNASLFWFGRYAVRKISEPVYGDMMCTDKRGASTKTDTFDPLVFRHLAKEAMICLPKARSQSEELTRCLKQDNSVEVESAGPLQPTTTVSIRNKKRLT